MIKTSLGLVALSMALGLIVQVRTENWTLAGFMAAFGIGALVMLAVVWRHETRSTKQT